MIFNHSRVWLCQRNGYWHINLTDKISYSTAVYTPCGHFHWRRLSFGLSSASEEYQRRMIQALSNLEGVSVSVDDILAYTLEAAI